MFKIWVCAAAVVVAGGIANAGAPAQKFEEVSLEDGGPFQPGPSFHCKRLISFGIESRVDRLDFSCETEKGNVVDFALESWKARPQGDINPTPPYDEAELDWAKKMSARGKDIYAQLHDIKRTAMIQVVLALMDGAARDCELNVTTFKLQRGLSHVVDGVQLWCPPSSVAQPPKP